MKSVPTVLSEAYQMKNHMPRKLLTLVVAVLVLNLFTITPTVAGKGVEEESRFAEKVQSEIARLGTGPDAEIEMKLRDKTKLKGYVLESDSTEFVVVEAKTGIVTRVMYPQVQSVKGHNLASGVKIAIGVVVVLVAIGVFCALFKPCASA